MRTKRITRIGRWAAALGTLAAVFYQHGAAMATGSITVYAHRGATAVAPENTVPALHAAAVAGLSIETDVRFTKSGIPVMLHDPTVDRTTNCTGNVADLWYSTLEKCRVDVGANHNLFSHLNVPSLAAALGATRGYGVRLNLEVKVDPTPSQVAKLVSVVEHQGMLGRATFKSASQTTMRVIGNYVASLGLSLPQGIEIRSQLSATQLLTSLPHLTYVELDPTVVTADYVQSLKAAGIVTVTSIYGVDDNPASWRADVAAGVVGITTNYPYSAEAVVTQ